MRNVIIYLGVFVLVLLMLTGCQLDQSSLRRRNPYTQKEYESYLEDKYDEDFMILSREEIYSLNTLEKIVYEIQSVQNPDIKFQAVDKNDGVAGWTQNDDYEQVLVEQK